MEEKINQILKNQQYIISSISWILSDMHVKRCPIGDQIIKDLDSEYWNTINLLNQTKQPSIAERTHDTLSKDGEQ